MKVTRYHKKGWVLAPATRTAGGSKAGKAIQLKGWQSWTMSDSKQYRWKDSDNFGLIHGQSGTADVDLDSVEAIRLAPYYLPPTATFGRDLGAAHWLYMCKDVGRKVAFKWPKDSAKEGKPDILEVLGDGNQSIIPPGIHVETGQQIKWYEDRDPAEISFADLVAAAGRLAAASLVLRNWGNGSRDEAASALSGMLIGGGWSPDEVKDWLDPILEAASDEERSSRLAKATMAEANLAADKPQYRFGRLAELWGTDTAESIKNWLSLNEANSNCLVTESLNKTMAHILYGNKTAVLIDREEDGTLRDESFISVHSARELYANKKVVVAGKMKNPVDIWLESPDRRGYPKGLVFDVSGSPSPGSYNLWRGWAVQPVRGDCSKFLDHIREVIASGNEDVYQWVIAWLADMFQNTARKPGVMLMLRGAEGTGKGTLVNEVGQLLGRHFVPVSGSQDLVRNFNAHLATAVLVFADEALWGGEKIGEGKLKQIITEPHMTFEKKGQDVIKLPSYHRIVGATNHEWAVPAGPTSRRFTILDISEHRAGDKAYFDAIHNEMNNGGREALLHFLLNFDIPESGADPRRCLMTDALRETREYTADPLYLWWKSVLEQGHLPGQQQWDTAPVTTLFDGFLSAASSSRRGSIFKESITAFGVGLRKIAPLHKCRKRIMGGREQHYQFASLGECITLFEKETGLVVDLEESPDDQMADF